MAQLQNTTIDGSSNLTLPVGTTAQRPSNPQAGMIRYNSTLNEAEYYDGTFWKPIGDTNPEATGGTIVDTEIGGVPYRIHLFTNTGTSTFSVTKGGEVEYLIVAGGGAGGGVAPQGGYHSGGGGGGAGGLLTGFATVTTQDYTITVGAGGTAASYNNTNGENSSAFGLTAIGGGRGYFGGISQAGSDGGSGGGAGRDNQTFGTGTAGQGNDGGADGLTNSGAGGGGAGSAGEVSIGPSSTDSQAVGGNGGQGILSNITGNNTFYAGGGAGGNGRLNSTTRIGIGGLGGGGDGKGFAGGQFGNPGAPNTGGGGGGGPAYETAVGVEGSAGGSGIVIVRYRRNASIQPPNPTIIRKSSLPLNTATNNSQIRLLRAGQDNLVMDYDAANTSSYPGTGTDLFDLSGNGNTATLVDGAVYNSTNYGTFVLDGIGETDGSPTGGYISVNSALTNTGISTYPNGCTYDVWVNADTDANDRMSLFFGAGSINHIECYTSSRYFRTEAATQNGKSFSSGTFPESCRGVWSNFTIVFSNTETNRPVRWYQNGILFGTGFMGNGNNPTGEYFNFSGLGRATGSSSYFYATSWKGKVSSFSLYNKTLTADEVKYNFNINRGRFGI